MKKNLSLAAIFAIIVFFTGCRKLIDEYFPGHDVGNSCKIKSITQDIRTGTFYYNKRGYLDSIIFDVATGSAGAQFHYFKYNKERKLIEYRGDYSREEGDYYFIHKYVYDDNLIVKDTSWVREAGTAKSVHYIEYDNKGRVIRETGLWLEGDGQPVNEPIEPINYYYDDNGNLMVNNTEGNYDDKKSFLGTSRTLMFTQRNYSKNNPLPVTSYNEEELPLGFGPEAAGGFLQWGLPSVIEYDCD